MDNKHVNVLIVGAGLSGIGAAYHIEKECSDKEYLILESLLAAVALFAQILLVFQVSQKNYKSN